MWPGGAVVPSSHRAADRGMGKVYPCIVVSLWWISRALEELNLTVLPVFILSLGRSVFLDILSQLCQNCFPSQLNFNVTNLIQILGNTPKYFYKSYSFSLERKIINLSKKYTRKGTKRCEFSPKMLPCNNGAPSGILFLLSQRDGFNAHPVIELR